MFHEHAQEDVRRGQALLPVNDLIHLLVVVDRKIHRAKKDVGHFASVSNQIGVDELLDIRPVLLVVDVLPRVQALILRDVELLIGQYLPQYALLHLKVLGRDRPYHLPVADVAGVEFLIVVINVLVVQILGLIRH